MTCLPTKYPRDICAYCGSTNQLETDHIPPKNLFSSFHPDNLITVSACSKCHRGTSKDDEYFYMKVCLRDDAGNHPAARAKRDAISRALSREQAGGLRRSFFEDMRPIELRSPSGLYVGKRSGYNVDSERIRKVVARVVRGLYFAEESRPLGCEIEVDVDSNDDLARESAHIVEYLKENLLTPLVDSPKKIIGDNVFTYQFFLCADSPVHSVWGLTFYGSVPFLCLTGPPRKNV